ncbi:MAG: putative aminohydrolase SsnA [Candidatus Eisenbacteria sp.]|nr:putative aminohydrolase SsnA [Candidatus Eisenbacteria bacterium]
MRGGDWTTAGWWRRVSRHRALGLHGWRAAQGIDWALSREVSLGAESPQDPGPSGQDETATLLVGPGYVVTPEGILPEGGVLVRGGHIARVGPYATLSRASTRASEDAAGPPGLLDTRGGLIMPGQINAHMHFYSALARGVSLGGEPAESFVQILERLWWRIDSALGPEDIRTSALLGLAECIRCGTTTVIDHHASPHACEGSLDLIRTAVDEAGLRAALCYEVSDRNGRELARAGIVENRRFARALAAEPADRIAAHVGVHALFTVSEETLEQCVAVAREEDIRLHLHVAEDRADVEHSLEHFRERPVERLWRHGALTENALAVHCVHVDRREIELLAATGTFVVHNPESNMNNAVGYAPIPELLEHNVCVGLGTDGMHSDMFAAARAAFLLQRHARGDPRAGWAEVPAMLWTHNARLASRLFGHSLGVLAQGAAADLVVLDYDPPTPLEAENLFAHLVFGFDARHVASTVVAGRVLMRDRELLTIDTAELSARAREQARALWERF